MQSMSHDWETVKTVAHETVCHNDMKQFIETGLNWL